MSLRTVTDGERRARLGARHVIEPARAGGVDELVDQLVVLHASDPASIHLAVGSRLPGVTPDDVDAALFDHRSIYRTLAMRRTLFVVTVGVGPTVEASSSPAVAAVERRRLEKYLAESGNRSPAEWIDSLAVEVLEALEGAGDDGRSARQLVAEVPRLATRIVVGKGTRQEGELTTTSRVLGLMAVEGLLIRGRPSGGWTGRQYRWHRRDRWWPDGGGPSARSGEREARAALVGRWLARFGPATLTDLIWWTGWTKTATRAALADLALADLDRNVDSGPGVVEVELMGECAGEPGYVLADDVEPVADPGPWAALFPALDPTAMGWRQRAWYLGDHRDQLFDRNGNVGPSVWVDGRIVGGWSQVADGEVVVELLEDIGADHRALVDAATTRISRFVGDTVVRPSFPTPLQKRLAGAAGGRGPGPRR